LTIGGWRLQRPFNSRKQFPWIQDSGRIQRILDSPEQRDSDRAMFLHHPVSMHGSNTVMIAQASSGLQDRLGSRALACSPELQLIPLRDMGKDREQE
jgi:ABC-type taurine transport system ATPase subunit